MNRIDIKFNHQREKGTKALMPFLTAGDPDLVTTGELILELEKNGADLIELGIPFSDPIADGSTIQASSQRALEKEVTLDKVIEFVALLRKKTDIPISLMSYYNPIFVMGEEVFFERAEAAGIDGVIVPDLPPEEAELLIKMGVKFDLKTIFLLAPTSTPERIKKIAEVSGGFIYYVSLTGVTGARAELDRTLQQNLDHLRAVTEKPIAVGFGVSTPDQARMVSQWADGVIVGSALIQKISQYSPDTRRMIREAGLFLRSLREGINGV
jgi:tryptophan synthase alpha chain